jgi:RNA polymerase sigma-70 factor, ECF subfamily
MSHPPTNDRIEISLIVLHAMRGESRALERLIDRFDQRLLYFVRKMIVDPHRAQDIVQETWICVFRTLPKLRDPQAFQSWLYRISHGFVVKDLRTEYRCREDEPLLDVADDSADEMELRAEQAAMIHAALDELSPPHREVLLLRFMEEFSLNDIATTLQLPLGSVKSRLHHAKLALRHVIDYQKETLR